jgi:hypothetical protein
MKMIYCIRKFPLLLGSVQNACYHLSQFPLVGLDDHSQLSCKLNVRQAKGKNEYINDVNMQGCG